MSLFSARFKFISIIIDTQTSWYIVADVIDNYGVYYADDTKLNDLVVCENQSQYVVSEITITTGARFVGKITGPVAPTIDLKSVIFTPGANPNFTELGLNFNPNSSLISEEFSTQEFSLTTTPKLGSLKVYQNGIRLRSPDDYVVVNSLVTLVDFEATDIIVVDYERL